MDAVSTVDDAPTGDEHVEDGEGAERPQSPATAQSLVQDLHALGVQEGATLIVHTSLSALG